LLVHLLYPYPEKDDPRNIAPYMYARGNWTFDDSYYDAYGKEGLELCKTYMNDLVNLLKAHGVSKISIVVYPWPVQIEHKDINSKQVTFWNDFSKEEDVNFVNMFPTFFSTQNISDYFLNNDVHWNTKGHQLVANYITNILGYNNQTFNASTSADLK
jgi:hypothetical protein